MPRKTKTKKQKVLDYLLTGKSITPSQAVAKFDSWRLADIVFKLKAEGFNILTTIPKGKVHAEYKLVK